MAELRAGAGRAAITPDIGCHIPGYYEDRVAVDIHGELYAKALVLDSGDTSLAVCVCDVIGLAQEDVAEAKAQAEALTGIPAANILVQATHTHYGPATTDGYEIARDEAYMERLPGRIATAIRLAQNRLRPAVVGDASAQCPGEVFNRRFWMKDGSVQMNPTPGPEIVRPAGPTDPEIGVLVVLDTERRPIAVVANYALHYVGGPGVLDTIVHADYFGAFDRALQRLAGADFVGMMMNGCCGDINHIDVSRRISYPHPFSEIDRVAEVVAGHVYAAWRGIRDYQPEVTLGAANAVQRVQRREVTPERLALAKERLARVRREGLRGPATSQPDFLFDVTATEIYDTPPVWELPVQAMRIGDLGLAALHSEVFVEIGLDIKRRSPFPRTLVAELANGQLGGYIPTDKAYDEGSYEVWSTPAERGTGEELANVAVRLLEELAGGDAV
jgi:neutral ceramidase